MTNGAPPPPHAAGSDDWRERRRDHVTAHAEALRRARDAEAEQAHQMLRQFAHDAEAAGLRPVELRATPYGGAGTYRTGIVGWYLKRDRSLGVDTAGVYYMLRVPREALARWRGVRLQPATPPLVVGKGGRDGESIDLVQLLRQRLEAGTQF